MGRRGRAGQPGRPDVTFSCVTNQTKLRKTASRPPRPGPIFALRVMEVRMAERGELAGLGLLLGAGVALGGWVFGQALIESRAPARLVTVKGLAERMVEADAATWRIAFRGVGESREEAIAEAIRARDAVKAFGVAGGLTEAGLSVEPFAISVERIYLQAPGGGQEERARYVASGAVRMRADEAGLIEAMTAETGRLLDAGVLLGGSDYEGAAKPIYAFTGLNEIKPALIAEATRAARASAAQFAEDSGSSVGRIVEANQGVIQLFAADGDYDERNERRKVVRVVSTVSYELTD